MRSDRHCCLSLLATPVARFPDRLRWLTKTLVVSTVLLLASCSSRQAEPTRVSASLSAASVPRYEVLELTLKHDGKYENNFFDVAVEATFTSPTSARHHIKGFYYGQDLWKVRFRPNEVGSWKYEYSLTANDVSHRGEGRFESMPSDLPGRLEQNRRNVYRWVFANGQPYFPVGLQDCIAANDGKFGGGVIDGGSREEGGRSVSWDEYFAVYGKAGFNLLRFSQRNCSPSLFDDLDHYRVAESIATDQLLAAARRNGFRIMFGFFGSYGLLSHENRILRKLKNTVGPLIGLHQEAILHPEDREIVAKEKRFIDYCIARWGVYADFWELLNERQSSDEWARMMAEHVHLTDPDRKPVGISWDKPRLDVINFSAPHWYESEDELTSDSRTAAIAAEWKAYGKPVLAGEQGNTGMNWDPRSALRMRIRLWTALFHEIALIFWNTSWSKYGLYQGEYTPGQVANIYLGPEERAYVRNLQDFSGQLDAEVHMAPAAVSPADQARAYALVSPHTVGVYLHHFTDHNSDLQGARLMLDLPRGRKFVGEWVDPASGRVLGRAEPGAKGVVAVPPFPVDIALLLKAADARDSDQRPN